MSCRLSGPVWYCTLRMPRPNLLNLSWILYRPSWCLFRRGRQCNIAIMAMSCYTSRFGTAHYACLNLGYWTIHESYYSWYLFRRGRHNQCKPGRETQYIAILFFPLGISLADIWIESRLQIICWRLQTWRHSSNIVWNPVMNVSSLL